MTAAAGLLGCSLEVMTEPILRNKTAELQRYPKDNELPQTHTTARPPTDFCFSPLNHIPLMTTSTGRELLHEKRCSGGKQNKA